MSSDTVFDVAILDYDGTLSDTRPAIAHCLAGAFSGHGLAIPAPQRMTLAINKGLPLKDTLVLLNPDLAAQDAALNDLVGTYRTLYRDEGESLVETFPATREALQEIYALDVRCVVVSNKGIDAVRRSLERGGLTPFVEMILADEPGLPHKPDHALLADHIKPQFPGIARNRMLMVGDTEIDIQFAKNTGIECCWAAYGFGDRRRCLALGPEYSIESIGELPLLMGTFLN